MKIKKFTSVLLSLVMVISMGCLGASANNSAKATEAENSIEPRMSCQYCGSTLRSINVCADEMIFLEDGDHMTLLGKCHMDLYGSHGATMCQGCHRVIELYAIHDCREYHINCSKGDYRVCPMDYIVPDFKY